MLNKWMISDHVMLILWVVLWSVDFVLLEDHMIKDFSHELSDTQQHVEQMVQQMMTSLANIRLARLTIDMVQYYT